MSLEKNISKLENILKELSIYEKNGLDTSSLHLFIKNLKVFSKIQSSRENTVEQNTTFEEKLDVIKSFLEDKKAFSKISDIIDFVNEEMSLGFKDQKESRQMTIDRIIRRFEKNPELKEKVKQSVKNIRNKKIHPQNSYKSKKELENVESFAKWAEILSKL
jgi:hypothetical protein